MGWNQFQSGVPTTGVLTADGQVAFEYQPFALGGTIATGGAAVGAAYARGLALVSLGTVTTPDPVGGSELTDEPYALIVSPAGVSPFGVGGGSRGYASLFSGTAPSTGRNVFTRQAGFDIFFDFAADSATVDNKSWAFGTWAQLAGGTESPATRANGFGLVSQGLASSNWQIVSRDGSSGITPIDTGVSRASTLNQRLTFRLTCPPGGSSVSYRFFNRTTNTLISSGPITGVLPALTQGMVLECTAETGISTATAVTLRVFRIKGVYGRSMP
jgi:hypothetical protein